MTRKPLHEGTACCDEASACLAHPRNSLFLLLPVWFHEASLSWITGQTNCNSETPRKEKSQKHHLQQRYQVHWASDSPPRLGVLGMSDYKKA